MAGETNAADAADAAEGVLQVRPSDHRLGAEDSRLTVIEYGDFGCPFCFAASRPLQTLLDRYEGLALVWRHFPDPELHPSADLAAELSELAADRGLFWEAHSMLLAGRDHFTMEGLLAVATRLGLERADAEAALDEHRCRDRVMEDVRSGERAGVHGTPTFFLNGERLAGHWSGLARRVPELLGGDLQE